MSFSAEKGWALDTFDRADGATIGQGWTISSGLQIVDHTVRAQSNHATRLLLMREHDASPHDQIGNDYRVAASMAITQDDDGDDDSQGGIVLRATSAAATKCYVVRIADDTGVATLYIDKWDGTATNLTSVAVTAQMNQASSSYSNYLQNLQAAIWDEPDGVRIEAYLNGQERPVLSYTDQTVPLWRDGGHFGWFQDGESASIENAVLDAFEVRSIGDQQDDFGIVSALWTFGRLRDDLRALALRDSSANVDEEFFGSLINEAEQDLASYLGGTPWWLKRTYPFESAANEKYVELPADVVSVGSTFRDKTSGITYDFITDKRWREDTGTLYAGVPYEAMLDGRGPSGGVQIRLYPTPDADGRQYEVPVWVRPKFLHEDSDIPDTPQQYCWMLKWGAVALYSDRDTNRARIAASERRWMQFKRQVRKELRQQDVRTSGGYVRSGLARKGRVVTIQQQAKYGWRNG